VASLLVEALYSCSVQSRVVQVSDVRMRSSGVCTIASCGAVLPLKKIGILLSSWIDDILTISVSQLLLLCVFWSRGRRFSRLTRLILLLESDVALMAS